MRVDEFRPQFDRLTETGDRRVDLAQSQLAIADIVQQNRLARHANQHRLIGLDRFGVRTGRAQGTAKLGCVHQMLRIARDQIAVQGHSLIGASGQIQRLREIGADCVVVRSQRRPAPRRAPRRAGFQRGAACLCACHAAE